MQTLKRHVHTLIAKGAFTAAITVAADLARRNPEMADCYGLIAEAEEAAGFTKAAIQSVSHAIALAPLQPGYRITRSRLYLKDRRLQDAIDDINSIIALERAKNNISFIRDAIACRDELLERLACSRPSSETGLTSSRPS